MDFAQRSPFAEMFQSTGKTVRAQANSAPNSTSCRWTSGPPGSGVCSSEQIGLILRRTVDADRPLSEYGLDSLGNLELRTRIEAETGIRITSTDINTTVRGLADLMFERLSAERTGTGA